MIRAPGFSVPLNRAPLFASAAIVTLGLGIRGTIAVAAVNYLAWKRIRSRRV
ncbi:MAG: hypothetical protein ACKVIN_06395 [Longimicrobiales bacterium]